MSAEVRAVSAEDIGGWADQLGVAFHHKVPEGYADHLLGHIDLGRTWGAFDGDSVVGTLRTIATELTVPGGKQVAASGLTNVTVAPTHRRSGLLTEMLTGDLARTVDRGEVVSILIASEYPIYGRFGYGPAVEGARYTVDTVGLRFREPSEGRVELVDRDLLRKFAPGLYDTVRRTQSGSIERTDYWWDRALQLIEVPGEKPEDTRQAVYRSPSGELEGYVRYKPESEWEVMQPKGRLQATELLATTPASYRALWGFCCSVDLLSTVEAGDRPTDDALPFMVVDGRAVRQTARYDFVWVRVLDVVTFLEGRSFACDGRLVIEVVDPLGYTSGRYRLEVGDGGAACVRTDESPEVTIPVDSLGSISLGGVALSRLASAGRVDEHRAGAAEKADAMFLTPRQPWCTTWF